MDGGRRLRRVCQAANAMALRAASDVSSYGEVGNISRCSEAKCGRVYWVFRQLNSDLYGLRNRRFEVLLWLGLGRKAFEARAVRCCEVEEFTSPFCEKSEGGRENTYGPRPMMAVSQDQAGVVVIFVEVPQPRKTARCV